MTPSTCTPESIASAKADAEQVQAQLRKDGVPLQPDGSLLLPLWPIMRMLLEQDHDQITAVQNVMQAVQDYGEERVLIWVRNAPALLGAGRVV